MEQEGVLAIDFGGTKIAIATADLQGRIIERQNIRTVPDAKRTVQEALRQAVHLVHLTNEHQAFRLVGVGVGTMGITDEDGVRLAPNVPGWEKLRLPAWIRNTFAPIPVFLANDVKCAALAEVSWGALKGMDPGIFVNLGTGLAAALVVGGRVILGAHGASGEIAYHPLTPDDVRGVRHGVAPLEEFVGGGSLKRRAAQEIGIDLEAGELLRQSQHEPRLLSWVDPILRVLAFHLTHLAIMVDPVRIVVGGGLVNVRDIIFPYLRQYFDEFVPFPPEVVPAFFHRDAGLMGAIALGLSGRI